MSEDFSPRTVSDLGLPPGWGKRWSAEYWFTHEFGSTVSGSCGTDHFPEMVGHVLRCAVGADDEEGLRAGEVATALIRYARPVCELEQRWVLVHPGGFGDLKVFFDPEAPPSLERLTPEERAAAEAALWAEVEDGEAEEDDEGQDDGEE